MKMRSKKLLALILSSVLLGSFFLQGCSILENVTEEDISDILQILEETGEEEAAGSVENTADSVSGDENQEAGDAREQSETLPTGEASYDTFSYADVPPYAGQPDVWIHGNVPFFTEEEIAAAKETCYEFYSPLDPLGRCGYAMASIGTELMPTEERGDIYWIHPSGWQSNSGYERSHLIAFQLCGENDNEQNLITGTHYLNGIGMLPYEEMVGDYIRETSTRVLYRVTPIFQGDELVSRGVLMEAMSLEDDGEDILYCVFIYNVIDPQEGKIIDYMTGEVSEGVLKIDEDAALQPTYIVNKNSLYFHKPDCDSAASMSQRNRLNFYGTREEAIAEGYKPCPGCNP